MITQELCKTVGFDIALSQEQTAYHGQLVAFLCRETLQEHQNLKRQEHQQFKYSIMKKKNVPCSDTAWFISSPLSLIILY